MKIGDKYSRLTVISEKYKRNENSYTWYVDCICDCGNEISVIKSSLTQTKRPTKSCGCLQKEKASEKQNLPIGNIFGRLTIKEDLGYFGKRRFCLSDCFCGTINYKVRWDLIKSGHTSSCGCLQKEIISKTNTTHGLSNSRTYDIWVAMKQRCSNDKHASYENYGGRGITYDLKWELFENFLEDVGECPFDNYSLDRINSNLGYYKENCRWADGSTQIHNQPKRKGNTTSKYKGVYFEKSRNKWVARLFVNNEKLLFKRFSTELEAAKAYDDKSEEIYGDRPNKTN